MRCESLPSVVTDGYAIETTNLSKSFEETTAVDGVSLQVPRGSIYGFLGPNGAGKTTTMRMLATMTEPSGGSARVAGHDIADRERVVTELGYLPEDAPVYDELTGGEQLRHAARLRDVPDATERIDDLLARFGLQEARDRRIDSYSKGMRRKLGLIQTLLHDPTVLLLDEPTSGLDPRAARTMRETLSGLADDDVTILLSSHVLSVVDSVADRVGVLSDGRLLEEAPPSELKARVDDTSDQTLEDAFFEVTADGTTTGFERDGTEPKRTTGASAGATTDGEE
ncbi:ABC transporter ATP-binding protein [Halobaculum sp. MBLA0143]|uniref:ABC transporter ATP-binding protein n=1 Tax=Halobaculum sp. MBLA0143 TaxID=3079933 RepID=UPI00352319C3